MGDADAFYQNEAFRLLKEAYEKQMKRKMDEAIDLYQKSLELYPTAEAHTYLGWAYSLKGRFEDAIAECKRAIEVDPDFGNPYNDIGAYFIEKGRYDEAIPWLEKATKASRYESTCYAYYNLGRVYEHQGNWFRAIQSYEDALNDNPQYTLAEKALKRVQAKLN